MKKTWKRLCTGFLALATVVTALPTTPAHAESKQYWTESKERVGIVEKVMNDGSIGSTFNEGHLTVEGEDAYCIDINTDFRNGYKTRADVSTRMSADQISDVALSIEYVKQYTDSHSGISNNHAYLLRQLVVWQRLSVHLGWQCDNVRASYDEIPKATQDEVFSGAKAFVKENKGRYEYGGYIYSGEGQELGQFWAKLNAGNAKLQKTSSNTSITDDNGNYSVAGATYGVFADKDCTKQLATLTTDENGNTDVVEVKAGTVYIKELSAPAGYKVDKTVYSLKVEAGRTATLKVSDISKVTDTLIKLFKIDMETQKDNPQGNASLAGAEFTWKYYAESRKMKPSKELLNTLHKELARFNPEAPLTMLFDYVKIRFPTLDIQHIIKDILKLNSNYMLHEDYGRYSYTEHYSLGDIFIYTSADEEKGVLLELKGRGCRQFESYLLAQQRSWYDFLMDALVDGGVMKRIDLAINDHTGILDIPELVEKCRKREYIGKSRSYKFYQSGELIKHREDDREYMWCTLYLGSLKSDVYFCIYEKDYEQYVKLGTPLEEADIINRFEIRLRNERAYYAVRDLQTYYDAEQTAFSIINQYVRFVDEEPDKRKNDWKLNDRWAWFIGDNRQSLKLTTKPEPYTLDRTLRWVQRQVAPTLKMLKRIDKGNGTDYMETIEQQAKLTEKHEMIIKQQTTPAKDLVES